MARTPLSEPSKKTPEEQPAYDPPVATDELKVFASQEEADAYPWADGPRRYEIRDPSVRLMQVPESVLAAKDAEIARLKAELSRARPPILTASERVAALAAIPRARRFQNMEREVRTFIDANGKICKMLPRKILDERYYPIDFLEQQGFELKEVDPSVQQIGPFSFRPRMPAVQ